ncbi:response regulator PleD [Phycisphaerae bacterium RAS1]|nr:response regulator PleD [Phycisphaerae bacterium RAS1]
MNWFTEHRLLLERVGAAVLLTGGAACCHFLRLYYPQFGSALVFFVVIIVSASLILLARGLGARIGAGLGVVVGLSLTIGLSRQSTDQLPEQLAFAVIAAAVLGLLGLLSGTGAAEVRPLSAPRRVRIIDAAEVPDRELRDEADTATLRMTPSAPDDIIGGILMDFGTWLDREAVGRMDSAPAAWPVFDQFLRNTLQQRLAARGVRVFRLSDDGDKLLSLSTPAAGAALEPISARIGLIGHVLTSGRVYAADDPDHGELIDELAFRSAEPSSEPGGGDPNACSDVDVLSHRWTWLLPIRSGRRTAGLVAVAAIGRQGFGGLTMAGILRDQIQVFWAAVRAFQALAQTRKTDQQSGILNRSELLRQVNEVVRNSTRDGEPTMVLALAIEGMRRLDDSGDWRRRDMLIEKLGQVLRARVRTDDILGRFSDDRFIVVLRRLDSALGTLIAEKLLEHVRSDVLTPIQLSDGETRARGESGDSQLAVRAGLAGTGAFSLVGTDLAHGDAGATAAGLAAGGGEAVLERALGLLDYARSQRIDMATDLMEGLPPGLSRDAGARGGVARGEGAP